MPHERRSAHWIRPAAAMVMLGGALLAYLAVPGFQAEVDRTVQTLRAGDVEALRTHLRGYGPWAPVVSAGLMVLQALVAPLPAFVLAYANGLLFGAFWGGLLSLGSATLAATIAFGLSRALGREAIEALVGTRPLIAADRWFARWGAWAVFVARLIPVVSFDLVSYGAGLTAIRLGPFLLATAAGAAPASFLYAWLGLRVPRSIFVVLAILAAASLLALFFGNWRRRRARDA